MSAIIAFAAFLTASTEIRIDEKPPEIEVVMKEMTDAMREIDTILKTVQNRTDAEKSAPQLKELGEKYLKLADKLRLQDKELGPAIKQQFEENKEFRLAIEKIMKENRDIHASIEKGRDRLMSKAPEAYRALQDNAMFKELDATNLERNKLNLRALTMAVKAYMIKNGNMAPPSLKDILPFIEGGEKALLKDPWGKPYQYDPAGKNNGGNVPDIWTVDQSDGKTPIGNWQK